MPSFDIVSEVDQHELTNAVDQASRELGQRFDFKHADASFALEESVITLKAQSVFHLKQMMEILRTRLAQRSIDTRSMDIAEPESNVATAHQRVTMKQGLDQAAAKDIIKRIKDEKLKVQASIQGDKLRVTGKKRDDLQTAIAFLRNAELAVPLQFDNFRD